MSFGEHLDELRVALIRAATWLGIGVAAGLFFGHWVMQEIQVPVKRSLEKFYLNQYTMQLNNRIESLRKAGYPETIAQIPMTRKMLPEEYYILPEDIKKIVILGNGGSVEEYTQSHQGTSVYQVDNLNKHKISSSASSASEPVQFFFLRPIEDDPRIKTTTLSMQESFSIWFKACFFTGLIIACPGIFYSLWSFVAAGLYAHEKRYVWIFLPVSLGLFAGGVCLAFFVVFQFVLDFLLMFNQWLDINPSPRITEWMGFALMLPVGFGISFQLPVVMFFLERVGILSVKTYLSNWRISVLVICFLSMVLTPADPWSMILMATPLIFLYFMGVGMCLLFPRKKGLYEEV
ncbi:MAG: twin-arginine translocase subunit TatC [Planctomycetaceae bacterium]|nr:twin-arginine translocase subunit TatC [Planctomycetaceae bacterium]